MDAAVDAVGVLEVVYQMGRRITYEVPPKRPWVDELVSYERGVGVFHFDHAASFAVPQWINPRGHYVYFVWGENVVEENGEDWDLLYRIAQHSLDSAWWEYADHIDLFQYADRVAAEEVERWSIAAYGPLYNDHGKSSPDLEVIGKPRKVRVGVRA